MSHLLCSTAMPIACKKCSAPPAAGAAGTGVSIVSLCRGGSGSFTTFRFLVSAFRSDL
jgi:hypothetical protein